MPITPKSAEEILQTSWEAWDKDEYGNVYIHDKWLKLALGSVILWAAEQIEVKPAGTLLVDRENNFDSFSMAEMSGRRQAKEIIISLAEKISK